MIISPKLSFDVVAEGQENNQPTNSNKTRPETGGRKSGLRPRSPDSVGSFLMY